VTTVPPVVEVTSDMDVSSLNQSVSRSTTTESEDKAALKNARQNTAWHCFQQFKEKYKAVYDIEYRDCDLHMYPCMMSEMWAQHKRLFGANACGDDCECAFHIPELTEHVVERFTTKHTRKNPTWVPPSRLTDGVGFVNRFGTCSFIRTYYEISQELF
jgi:hypothetical protein